VHLSAAVLGQKANQVRSLGPVHGVKDEATGAPCGQQAGTSQRIQMMGKSGARYLEPPLDVVDAIALRSRADQQPKDGQSVRLPQSTKLFDSSHNDISSIIEKTDGSSRATTQTRLPMMVRAFLVRAGISDG
jgi:hypothetical protein